MKIEEIDKNFRAATVGSESFRYLDVNEAPFSLEGFPWREKTERGRFYRMPDDMKGKVNDGAFWLRGHTAGGAVRFRSDSKKIALRAELVDSSDMNHMPRTGSSGFDIYLGTGKNAIHRGTGQPTPGMKVLELIMVDCAPDGMSDWQVNFPLYGGVEKLEIGVLPGSRLEPPTEHKIKKPILFYGSSITQGGCASRPGNAYTTMLCRSLDAEQVNLGFSGCGRGEPGMAEQIAGLDLAAFVMDYDHNAPSVEHLQETHETFFRIIREKHPELPIILMSRCDIFPELKDEAWEVNVKRREVIYATYRHAIQAGDKNVYFIDGETLFGKRRRCDCTVDHCHPNDLGFYRMARTVLPVLKKALKK